MRWLLVTVPLLSSCFFLPSPKWHTKSKAPPGAQTDHLLVHVSREYVCGHQASLEHHPGSLTQGEVYRIAGFDDLADQYDAASTEPCARRDLELAASGHNLRVDLVAAGLQAPLPSRAEPPAVYANDLAWLADFKTAPPALAQAIIDFDGLMAPDRLSRLGLDAIPIAHECLRLTRETAARPEAAGQFDELAHAIDSQRQRWHAGYVPSWWMMTQHGQLSSEAERWLFVGDVERELGDRGASKAAYSRALAVALKDTTGDQGGDSELVVMVPDNHNHQASIMTVKQALRAVQMSPAGWLYDNFARLPKQVLRLLAARKRNLFGGSDLLPPCFRRCDRNGAEVYRTQCRNYCRALDEASR